MPQAASRLLPGLIALLCAAGPALAQPAPTVDAWVEQLGAPTKGIEASDRVRSPEEPLLLYWMQTQAAPLGLGPALPGTLVANFARAETIGDSRIAGFTFLAVADAKQTGALVDALRKKGWLTAEKDVQRRGGTFREHTLALPDGLGGTLAVRQGAPAQGMADGRPSPSLWVYVSRQP